MAVYPTLISKIGTILESVKSDGLIQEHFSYPATKYDSFPAVLYYPTLQTSEPEGVNSNYKVYTFDMYAIIGISGVAEVDDVYSTHMPALVDAINTAFDTGWDFDAIDGRRVWMTLDNGEWATVQGDKGLEVYSKFTITVKMLTDS